MPYCSNCSAKSDGKFCPNCGAPLITNIASAPGYSYGSDSERPKEVFSSAPAYSSDLGVERSQRDMPFTSGGYGFVQRSEQPGTGATYGTNVQDYKLRWHKFLVNFLLWFTALLNFGNGVMILSSIYDLYKLRLYVDSRRVLLYFIVAGGISVICFALGVLQIYVRFQLAGFKKNAPKKLILTYGVNIGVGILTTLAFLLVSRWAFLLRINVNSVSIPSIVWSIVWMYLSWRYYFSREELFVN